MALGTIAAPRGVPQEGAPLRRATGTRNKSLRRGATRMITGKSSRLTKDEECTEKGNAELVRISRAHKKKKWQTSRIACYGKGKPQEVARKNPLTEGTRWRLALSRGESLRPLGSGRKRDGLV